MQLFTSGECSYLWSRRLTFFGDIVENMAPKYIAGVISTEAVAQLYDENRLL